MNSFVATLQQLGPARLGVMGAIMLGFLMFFVFISMRVTSPELKLLYADLSSTDAGAVAAKLEETQIPYEISQNGTRIMVPSNEVGRARILLAEAGLPNGGSLGYEIFDQQSGFGTTNFVQNINQIRALEGELARTIMSMENIRSARVHISMPQRELFSRDSRTPSAGVSLGINGAATLEREQILAIQSLVASAIPGLKAKSVSVIDSNGTLHAKGGEEDNDLLTLRTEDLRRNFESRLQSKIEEQVGRIVGYGKVTAIVTADMNFDQVSMNEELYNPEGQVLRSTQTTQEDTVERDAVAADDVSVATNLPGVGGDLLSDTEPSLENSRVEEVSNFEISKTIRNTIRQSGEVNKLSISVLIDGRYITDEEGNRTYQERPPAEIEQIAALVRTAVGFDENRGDVIEVANLQFAQIDVGEDIIDDRMLFGFEKNALIDAAEVLVIALMFVLVVVLVLQPMMSKVIATTSSMPQRSLDEMLEHELLAASPANPALAPPQHQQIGADGQPFSHGTLPPFDDDSMVDIQGIEGKVKASTVKRVEEIVETYPAESVSVIRSWMSQETS